MKVFDEIKKIENVKAIIRGKHPDGKSYEHSKGIVDKVWKHEFKEGFYVGFHFKQDNFSGYTWPGIDHVILLKNGIRCIYSNGLGDLGYADIILLN